MTDYLNWRTDPLLLDNIPTTKNDWLTSNKLIEQQVQGKMFLQKDILNLYSIMVRKIDFQSGERLLQRLPYITLPEFLANKVRKTTLNLAERCHHYFRKTTLDYSIKKWQAKLIDYLENQKRLPFPLFRLSDHWQEFLTQEYIPFQSARGEHFHLPTRLTGDLAYFLGVVIGDGHLNFHNIELVDFSEEQMLYLQEIALALFNIKGAISGEKKIWLLHLNNKWLVRLANFLIDQPITGKKYHALREPLIFQSDEALRWQFWSGVLDADGSYKNKVSFCTSSEFFAQEFVKVLKSFEILYSLNELHSDLGKGHIVVIKAVSKDILSRYLQPRHPSKQKDFEKYLTRQRYNLTSNPTDYQFYKFNPKTILSVNNEEYFDFHILQTLHVVGCAKFLRMVREIWSWTQQELAEYFGILKSKLASYEYRDSLPIPLIEKLLSKLPDAPKNLMSFLAINKLEHFRSRRAVAKLDLQPNEKLLNLVKNLSFRSRYLLIHSTNGEVEDVQKNLSDYFKVQITVTSQIHNSVLHLYLKTFFQTINSD